MAACSAAPSPGAPPADASAAPPCSPILTSPPPVRDLDGLAVWRVRVASQDEMTCTQCGETTDTGRCYRCGADLDDFDGIETPMVPTLSYLKPGEYDLIRRSWS